MPTTRSRAAGGADDSATTSFAERVYGMVRRVPRGRIVSYGGVAALLGQPRAARGVGQALHALPEGSDVPWWRVVNRNGEISIRGFTHAAKLQRTLLTREGVKFDRHGRIDWARFGWDGAGAHSDAEADDSTEDTQSTKHDRNDVA